LEVKGNPARPGYLFSMKSLKMNYNRRDFLKVTSASVTAMGVVPEIVIPGSKTTPHPICVFSLCLQFLDYDDLGKVVASSGFDGAELIIRNQRHIEPENVKTDLPKAVRALRRAGVDAPMIVTEITDADHQITSDILGTAADLGIKYYRMGRYYYDHKRTFFENLDSYKRKLEKLETINRKYDIRGNYQNHSGPWGMVGGAVWDLYYILKDLDSEYIGIQYDIMHATAEGGYSWALALKQISPWIHSLAIKDFVWEKGKKRWQPKYVPLGEGMVDFKNYLKQIEPILSSVPITIHYEYDLGGAEEGSSNPSMPPEKIYNYLVRDLRYFKNRLLRKY